MSGEAVSVRTRFERFPATVKGAFVIRGEDTDPHQVKVRGARVARVSGSGERELPVEAVTVDIPPHQDLFVPFEVSVADMEPGWYGLELEVEVDGSPRTFSGDRRFVVAWPRGSMRSGIVPVERNVKLGKVTVRVERVQCSLDSTSVRFVVHPAEEIAIRLEADGSRLHVLDHDLDPATGRGAVTAYPLFRSNRRLRIEVSLKQRGPPTSRGEVVIPLPS